MNSGPGYKMVEGGWKVSTEFEGVLTHNVQWEHYCQRIEDMDLNSSDDANFLCGTLSFALSTLVAVIAVLLGTDKRSPALVPTLVALLVASLLLSAYFGKRYLNSRERLAKAGKKIARELREHAAAQRTTTLQDPDTKVSLTQ